jgi:hypothetical protein
MADGDGVSFGSDIFDILVSHAKQVSRKCDTLVVCRLAVMFLKWAGMSGSLKCTPTVNPKP